MVVTERMKKDKKRKNTALRKVGRVIGTLCLIMLIAGLICILAFAYYIKNYMSPNLDIDLDDFKYNQSTYVYYIDENGKKQEMATLTEEGIREWVSITDMPKCVQDAAIAIEDERFWEHNGVDWKRTTHAVLNLFTGGDSTFGASTITQQLVKNLTGDDDVSMTRKIEEILRALNLQKNNTKEEVLEYYLNAAFFSERCYGIGAASQVYFGKPASELTPAEAAAIIGITKYPSKYNPYNNPEENKARQETVLYKMYEQEYLTKEEYEEAIAQELKFKERSATGSTGQIYSYFVDMVYYQVIDDLVEEYGYERELARSMVMSGGLEIITTMDKRAQDCVDEAFTNEENWAKVRTDEQLEGAITVIDNSTGAIAAVYGGRGEKTKSLLLNKATDSYRQPGSTIKPLSVYAPAIEYGVITEGDVYMDTPYEGKWPKNQSGGYTGPMTIKTAVGLSKNTVAVKVLADLGVERSYDFIKNKLGVDSIVESKTVGGKQFSDIALAPLALGGLTDGVTTLEMAAAYETFANEGIYTEPYCYTEVYDSKGNLILENKAIKSVAMSEQTAFIMNDLLQYVTNSGTGTAAKMANMPVASKTGTTDDDNDRWFAGYTPYYTAVVWVGYEIPQKIVVSGINPALRLWRAAMHPLHSGLSYRGFSKADGVTSATYCKYTGDVPTEQCTSDFAYYVKGTTPAEICQGHTATGVYDAGYEYDATGNPIIPEVLPEVPPETPPETLPDTGEGGETVTPPEGTDVPVVPETPPADTPPTDEGNTENTENTETIPVVEQ